MKEKEQYFLSMSTPWLLIFFTLQVMSGILHNVIGKYEEVLNTVEDFGTHRIKKLDSHCFCLLVFIHLHISNEVLAT